MKAEERLRFAHRKNNPPSFDSICLKCFRTISRKETEEQLRQDEDNHVCEADSLGGSPRQRENGPRSANAHTLAR
jgi:hypothetical protein